MSFVLSLLLLIVPLALAVRHFNQGLWGGVIQLVNITTAALIATSNFEPLAHAMQGAWDGLYYWADFLAAWLIFGVSLFVMTLAMSKLSGFRLKFPKQVDQIGGALLQAWAGWALVCFLTMTLHMAPLAKNFFFGGFKPEQPLVFGFAPDRLWLGYAQKLSLGTFSAGNVFDPQGDFMIRYASKRLQYERADGMFNSPPPMQK